MIVAVVAVTFEAEIDGGDASVHRPRGPLPPRVRREGDCLFRTLAYLFDYYAV